MTSSRSERQNQPLLWETLFGVLIGLFLALSLLKFGNPVILDYKVVAPSDVWELFYSSWPIHWGYFFLGALVLASLPLIKFQKLPRISYLLPIWLVWQFIAAGGTVDRVLTVSTLKHFVACVICFYLGCFAVSRINNMKTVCVGLLLGFLIVLKVGFAQHFGGLEESRRYFILYIQPTLANTPPELLQKMQSTRIFSTLFYPNSLAAVILMVLPIALLTTWNISHRFQPIARKVLVAVIGLVAMGCLYWSGSKSGWLLMLLMAVIVLCHLSFSRKIKIAVVSGLVVIGLAGFFWKYAKFFEKGATSVGARFDYWKAAAQITKEHSLLGSGPGTFSVMYEKVKKPESEMARLCHNDFIEQACDSGIIGFLSFTGFFIGSFWFLYRKLTPNVTSIAFVVWLGLLCVCLHCFVEFNLYIPALAWPMFLFLGWLFGSLKPIDNKGVAV